MSIDSGSRGSSHPSGIAGPQAGRLPVTDGLAAAYVSSLLVALLVAIATVAGLMYGPTPYPTERMLLLKLPTDLFTLVVGLPLLLGSMWLARRGVLLGLLSWPGVLLYVLYIYLSYAIGVPLKVLFLAYVLLVAVSAYTVIGLVASIDATAVRQRVTGNVPARTAGGVLVVLAVLFTLMNTAQVLEALAVSTPDDLQQVSVWIADYAVMAPAWLLGGLMLWQRKPLGYVVGVGLLLLGSMLFVGVIVNLAFPALYTGSPVDVTGTSVILVMGLICFVPFALFVRGIVRSYRSSSPA